MDSKEIQKIKLRFGIIGNSEELNRAIEIAMQVAPADVTVLVTGESGVGKEFFSADNPPKQRTQAQQVHRCQLRRHT